MATTKKKSSPKKKYTLSLAFDPDELATIEALEKDMGIRRTPILRLLIADEAKRRGLK